MKKLLSRITIALFLTLYTCYPVHAGVGDVYYCTEDFVSEYNGNGNLPPEPEKSSSKFKFKWEDGKVSLDDVSLGALNIIHSNNDNNFLAVRTEDHKGFGPIALTLSFTGASEFAYKHARYEMSWFPFNHYNKSIKWYGRCSKF